MIFRRRDGFSHADRARIVLAILFAVLVFLPFLWALRLSIQQTHSTYVSLLPGRDDITIANFTQLLTDAVFLRWILNSVIFATSVTLGNIVFAPLAGYALAKRRLPGSNFLFLFVIAMWILPYQVTLIPLFIGLSRAGLVNTFPGLILPLIVDPLAVLLMRQFMVSIPATYEEAAIIDGCNRLQSFFRITLPMSTAAIMVVSVTIFMFAWGDLILPLVLTNSERMTVLTVGVAQFSFGDFTDWGRTMAAAIIGSVPTILLFLVLNKYFFRGIVIGEGIKG